MAEIVTQAERKRRLIVLVISIFVIVVSLAVGGYSIKKADDLKQGKADNNQDLPDSLKTLRLSIVDKENELQAIRENMRNYLDPWGWKAYSIDTHDRFVEVSLLPKPPSKEVEPVAQGVMKFIDLWIPELQALGADMSKVTPYFKKEKKKDADGKDIEVETFTGANDKLVITEFVLKCQELEKKLREETGRLQISAEELTKQQTKDMQDIRKDDKQAYENLKQPIEELAGDQKLLDSVRAAESAHYEDNKKLEDDLVAKREEYETMFKSHRDERLTLEAKKHEIQTRINFIRLRREQAEDKKDPDGRIIGLDPVHNLVYVDLTKKDRLFKHTRFNVFSMEKGQLKVDRGIIEVIDIGDDYATCFIVKTLDPNVSLKVGDRIYNTYYDRDVPNHIVVAGRLTKYSRNQVTQKLRDLGDVYEEKVTDQTNYCIVGENYENDPVYLAARDMGVRILTEKYIYDYLDLPY